MDVEGFVMLQQIHNQTPAQVKDKCDNVDFHCCFQEQMKQISK